MKTKYQFLHTVLQDSCDQMLAVLNKASVDANGNIDRERELLASALAPDMLNFTKQVQIFSDNAKGAIARFSNTAAPVYEDTENTLEQLKQRVQKTKEFIMSVDVAAFEKADELEIHLGWMPEGKYFIGEEYSTKFALQNTFFHLVTAYDILRMKGVNIGKQDYISEITMHGK